MPSQDLGPIIWEWKGEHQLTEDYVRYDAVSDGRNVFGCINDAPAGITTDQGLYWGRLATGQPISAHLPLGKADPHSVGFVKTGAESISIKAGSVIPLKTKLYQFKEETPVEVPAPVAGTAYHIFLCEDGVLRADADDDAPSGFTAAQCVMVGGFYFADSNLNIDSVPNINAHSIWDVDWRPRCPKPDGMAKVPGVGWVDINPLAVEHAAGSSIHGAIIADGANPPKVPAMFGGDGTAVYTGFNWHDANQVVASHGKKLLTYHQFCLAAFGVTERESEGSDQNLTDHWPGRVSQWGIEGIAGTELIMGGSAGGPDAGSTWQAAPGNRGETVNAPNRVALGGDHAAGTAAGSRAADWSGGPEASAANLTTRGWAAHGSQWALQIGGGTEPDPVEPGVQYTLDYLYSIIGIAAVIDFAEPGNQTLNNTELQATADLSPAGRDALAAVGEEPVWKALAADSRGGALFDANTNPDVNMVIANDPVIEGFNGSGFAGGVVFRVGSDLGPGPRLGRLYSICDPIEEVGYAHLQAGPDGTAHRIGFYWRFDSKDLWLVSANAPVTANELHYLYVGYSPVAGAKPVIRLDGAELQMNYAGDGSPSAGNPLDLSGKSICIGNRLHNSKDRPLQGELFTMAFVGANPALAEQAIMLNVMKYRWPSLVALDPFMPTIEDQTLNAHAGMAIGDTVGTIAAQGLIDSYVLGGDALTYFELDGAAVKIKAALPAAPATVTGSIEVTNEQFGRASAALSIEVSDQPSSAPLKYAMPNLSGFTTVQLDQGSDVDDNGYGPLDKVLVKGPVGGIRTANKTSIGGAGTVVFEGGHFKPATKVWDRAIRALDIHHEIIIEGLDVEPAPLQDAFQLWGHASSAPIVTIQNVYVSGVTGNAGEHGDVLQVGSERVAKIRIFELVGVTDYQGFFLPKRDVDWGNNAVDEIELERVELRYTNPNNGDIRYLYWFGDAGHPSGITLGPDVWCDQKNDQRAEDHAVWPKEGQTNGAQRTGDVITFDTANVTGEILVGRPPIEMVDRSLIGVGYVNTRGYA